MARVGTGFVWLVAALLWVATGGASQRGEWVAAMVLGSAAVAVAVLVWYYRRAQPVSYRVEPGGLVISQRGTERRFDGAVSGGAQAGLGVRLFGSGGLYGYIGWFRVGGARARAYVTDRGRTVIVSVGTERVAISPASPGAFLAEPFDA